MSNNNSFIKQSVVVKSSREIVFKALTQADELVRWFPTRAESDPRAGGKIKLFWEFTDASQNGSQEGEYIEVVPNEKLSYTWMADSIPTLVTFTLNESNGETTVDLEHSTSHEGADEKKLHDDHANQWGFFLMNLKGYLESGADLRAEKLNQVTM
ncbi:MAG TPA: SRPBCC domain-containing protein [Anaerolineales bacterium]|nr:SRPBCC domain-containing protein [Anaerolineales bacterium]